MAIIYIILPIVFYLFMMGVTVWIGGRCREDSIAIFCWIWPLFLPIIFFMWLYYVAENRSKTKKGWQSK